MTHFNYIGSICGGRKPYTVKIKLCKDVDVSKGEILYFDEAKGGVTPEKSADAAPFGVCAESYRAQKNELVPDYGSGKVKVIVSTCALYRTEPYTVTDSGARDVSCVKTSFVQSDGVAEYFVGKKLVLICKGEGSSNTGSYGQEYTVTGVSEESGCITLKLDGKVDGGSGDRYAFVPEYGFKNFGLDTNKDICISADGTFKVTEADESGYTLMLGE